jgi:S1-C subfamily serine protease
VTLQDNMTLKAQIIGASAVADIVLLKVNADRPLPAARPGDSQSCASVVLSSPSAIRWASVVRRAPELSAHSIATSG